MTKLPPCPIEGCKSESDHHCHWSESAPWVEDRTRIHGCACDATSEYATACYSRALKPAPLMLSVETVAKLIKAAETAAYERGYLIYVQREAEDGAIKEALKQLGWIAPEDVSKVLVYEYNRGYLDGSIGRVGY